MAIRNVAFTPSQNVAIIQYDEDEQTLTIWFQKGGLYRYYQVPGDVVDGFARAPSATKYMQAYISNTYPEERLA